MNLPSGNFCWFDLATTDQVSSKKFYLDVFGWEANDMPMDNNQFYSMLSYRGKTVGAIYTQQADEVEQGIPPHWTTSISADDVDAMTDRAWSLGGKVVVTPMDVGEHGRMSGITDPTGAFFFLWKGYDHPGVELQNEPYSFGWHELQTNDTSAAQTFYTGLFGWEASQSPTYTQWVHAGTFIGGMFKIQPEWGPVPPHWLNYIMVEDTKAMHEKIVSLGGALLTGPQTVPNTGTFAVFKDPQGAVFAVLDKKF